MGHSHTIDGRPLIARATSGALAGRLTLIENQGGAARVSTMNSKSTCPLCNGSATVNWIPNRMAWVVTCVHCTRYTIDDYLMCAIELARDEQDEPSITAVSWLSQQARETTAAGARLNLSVETFLAVLHDARHASRSGRRSARTVA